MAPEEALRGYTSWSTHAAFVEDLTVALEVGKWADVTVCRPLGWLRTRAPTRHETAIQLIVHANRELARRESEGHEVVREALAVSVE